MLRIYKRILIGFVTLMVMGLPVAIFIIGGKISQPEPTCFDNVYNQDEEGVDCGGSCLLHCPDPRGELLEVERTEALRIGSNIYDIIARVKNPNSKLGAAAVTYTMRIRDMDGDTIRVVGGEDFLLPQEELFLVSSGISLGRMPGVIEVVFDDIAWSEPLIPEPHLEVINPVYRTVFPGEGFVAEVTGVIKNTSTYGFNLVRVQILLFDEESELISVVTSDVNTLQSNEARFFKVTWPEVFGRSVRDVRVFPRTNIFNEPNILRPEPEKEHLR